MSFSMYVSILVLASMTGSSIQASNMCKEGKDWWYDIQAAKCRPCKECSSKAFMMEPCSNFMDTMCIDFSEIKKSFKESRIMGEEIVIQGPHKWHEMEGPDSKLPEVTTTQPFISATAQQAAQILFCMGAFFILMAVIFFAIYVKSNWKYQLRSVDTDIHPHNRFLSPRDKRIARDRFNTTEYMNNLATLDTRLAMDEILEKRKKTIFEPPLLVENVYVDEIIDCSEIPKKQGDGANSEEPEHRRWLLRMRENQ